MIAIAFRLRAVRLLQVAAAAGSRNPGIAASAQCPAAARTTPIAFALGRPRPCQEPSWNENMELRFDLAVNRVHPQSLLQPKAR